MRIPSVCVLVLSISSSAFAQQPSLTDEPRRLIISSRAIDMAIAAHPMETAAPPPASQSRDSVKNGAIIGAVIGGAAMAAGGSWVCGMLREPSDPPCWKSVLPVAGIAAAIGAAAGAGIDALASRSTSRPPAPNPVPVGTSRTASRR